MMNFPRDYFSAKLFAYTFARNFVMSVMELCPEWVRKTQSPFLEVPYFRKDLCLVIRGIVKTKKTLYAEKLIQDLNGEEFNKSSYERVVQELRDQSDPSENPIFHFAEFCLRTSIYAYLHYLNTSENFSEVAIMHIKRKLDEHIRNKVINENNWLEVVGCFQKIMDQ